jgi:L-ascorbate metabolism protein UlaG (beta-lactamase superfamily)
MHQSTVDAMVRAISYCAVIAALTSCHSEPRMSDRDRPAPLSAAPRGTTLPDTEKADPTVTGSISFIGNATVLIRYAGFTILTDPTFIHKHEQVSIGYGMHTTRLTDPSMDIGDLPPLDLILLSHFHGDHFDQVAERDLDKSLPILTTPEAAIALHERGFKNATALEQWSTKTVQKGAARLRVTSMPGRHGPPLVSAMLPQVMGSMLEFQATADSSLFRLYITGDTLVIDDIKDIPRRYPDIHLALLHLGGTRVMGILVTMDGRQGVEMMRIVNPRLAIPIHYDDYDVFKSPLSDFQREVRAAGLEDRVHYLDHGDTYTFAASPSP